MDFDKIVNDWWATTPRTHADLAKLGFIAGCEACEEVCAEGANQNDGAGDEACLWASARCRAKAEEARP